MNTFKVIFADGNHTTTDMNATLDEARAYYVGTFFNFGDTDEHPKDRLVKDVAVEPIKTIWDDDGTNGPVLICPPPTQRS